jgi:hypothetical protein
VKQQLESDVLSFLPCTHAVSAARDLSRFDIAGSVSWSGGTHQNPESLVDIPQNHIK